MMRHDYQIGLVPTSTFEDFLIRYPFPGLGREFGNPLQPPLTLMIDTGNRIHTPGLNGFLILPNPTVTALN